MKNLFKMGKMQKILFIPPFFGRLGNHALNFLVSVKIKVFGQICYRFIKEEGLIKLWSVVVIYKAERDAIVLSSRQPSVEKIQLCV